MTPYESLKATDGNPLIDSETHQNALAAAGAAAHEFVDVDANADGLVTSEEMRAAEPDITVNTYAAADIDGDGALNADEFDAKFSH